MTMITGNFADLIDPAIRKILFQRFASHKDEYTELFDMRTSDRAWEKESSVTGTGTVPVKTEGVAYSTDTPVQGNDVTSTHVSYGLMVVITREMQSDDLFGIIAKMTSALGRSGVETVETEGANMLNRAFNTSYLGPDGVTLCNTAHIAYKSGSTWSNRHSTDADLTATSLEQALIDGANIVNDAGLITPIRYKKLVVPAELRFVARRLLETEKMPGTAQNDVNVLKDEGLTYSVNNYLTDTDAWFLRVGKEDLSCPWYWREKPNSKTDRDVNTDDVLIKLFFRFSRTWIDPRDWYGSQGTA